MSSLEPGYPGSTTWPGRGSGLSGATPQPGLLSAVTATIVGMTLAPAAPGSLGSDPVAFIHGDYPGSTVYPGSTLYPGRGGDLTVSLPSPPTLVVTPV